jgi:hypothetical protein
VICPCWPLSRPAARPAGTGRRGRRARRAAGALTAISTHRSILQPMSEMASPEGTTAVSSSAPAVPPHAPHREMQAAFTSVAQPPLAAFEALVDELLTMQVCQTERDRPTFLARGLPV